MDVEKKSLTLIHEALLKGASDIHFQPKMSDILIQFRINGQLQRQSHLRHLYYERLLSHLKFQANMDIGEKRRPQNGSLALTLQGQRVNIRLSTIPTPFYESLVLRLLPQDELTSIDELFLFSHSAKQLSSLMQNKSGFTILTGPTGTGKTTTIYALLHEAAVNYNRRVITIEEPIEKIKDTFVQMEVNEKAGITFSEGFKASLRQDPDIIMIGEIRDDDTAKIAIKAALSGHFVITTMHAKNTLGALYRLREFGISLVDIEQTITAVATQKLVNTVCPLCPEVCEPACIYFKTNRRLAVLELLSGNPLTQALAHLASSTNPLPEYSRLADEVHRGMHLGYLSKKTV